MNTVVLTLAAIVVTVLTALFAIPPLVDWNAYRGVFEVEASRLLGRDVRVRGDVALSLLPVPYLQFEDVTVANARGVTGEPFLRAKSFSLQLSAPPLLRGAIEAKQIDVEGARFRLRLDAEGRGNWQDFDGIQRRFGLAPTEIALNAVNFNDVGVTLERADGARVFQISGVSGELSAPQARGPFRFRGAVGANEASGSGPLDLRISTGVWDVDGRADVRVALSRPSDKKSLTVTGNLDALGRKPFGFLGRVEGDLAMLLPVPEVAAGTERAGLGRGGQRIEGAMRITPQKLDIQDLKLDLSNSASPQMLMGSAAWRLADDAPLDVVLRSSLLDADQLGLGSNKSDGVALYRMGLEQIGGLGRTVAALGRPTVLDIRVDRLVLGRKSLSGIEFVARLSERETLIRRLKLHAPGATTTLAAGRLETVGDNATAFAGTINLGGRNLRQFAQWVWPNAPLAEQRAQRPFALRGNIIASGADFALSDTRLNVGRDTIFGAVTYDSSDGGSLKVEASGPVLDLALFDDDLLSPARLRTFLAASGTSDAGLPMRTNLVLTVGQLRDARRVFQDVAVSVDRQAKGAVALERLTFSHPEGAEVAVQGGWTRVGARIVGDISGRVRTKGPASAKSLLSWSAAVADLADDTAGQTLIGMLQSQSLPASDLALTVSLPDTGAPLRISADGRLGRDMLRLEYQNEGGDLRVGDAEVKLDLQVRGPLALDSVRIARGLSVRPGTSSPSSSNRGAAVRVIAKGKPTLGLRMTARLELADATLDFDGTLKRVTNAGGSARWAATGEAGVETQSSRRLLSALHLQVLEQRVANTGFRARAAVIDDGKATRIDVARFEAGTVSGRGTFEISSVGAITGDLRLSRVALSDGFALLSRPSAAQATSPRVGDEDEIWPASVIDLTVFRDLDLDIAVRSDELAVTSNTSFADASLRLKLANSAVAIDDLQAKTPVQGQIKGSISIAPGDAGYALSSAFEITKSALGAFAGVARTSTNVLQIAPPDGQAEFAFKLTGRGTTVRSLIALARGDGRVRLRGVALNGVAPAAIRAAGDAFGVDDKITASELAAVLRRELLARRSVIGDQDLAVAIRDGIVRFAPLRVGFDGGRIENTTTLALSTLQVDSRWRLTPVPGDGDTDPLPAVELIYDAPVRQIARTDPDIRLDALARELVVRRLEGNVAELERLRRLDEERARKQAELQAQRERERAAARAAAERAERERRAADGIVRPFGPEALPGLTPDEGTVRRTPLPPPGERSSLDGAGTRSRTELQTYAAQPRAREEQVRLSRAARRRRAEQARRRLMRLGAGQNRATRSRARRRSTSVRRRQPSSGGWQGRALFSDR